MSGALGEGRRVRPSRINISPMGRRACLIVAAGINVTGTIHANPEENQVACRCKWLIASGAGEGFNTLWPRAGYLELPHVAVFGERFKCPSCCSIACDDELEAP